MIDRIGPETESGTRRSAQAIGPEAQHSDARNHPRDGSGRVSGGYDRGYNAREPKVGKKGRKRNWGDTRRSGKLRQPLCCVCHPNCSVWHPNCGLVCGSGRIQPDDRNSAIWGPQNADRLHRGVKSWLLLIVPPHGDFLEISGKRLSLRIRQLQE